MSIVRAVEATPSPDLTGDLRRTPVAQLMWDVIVKRLTGSLVLHAGAEAGPLQGVSLLTFVAGGLTQARLAQPLDTLGFVLLEQGVITSAQLDASLHRLARREGLQGEILIALEACSRAAVEVALREQIRRKLLRVFTVVYGQYELYTDRDLLADFGRERYPVDVAPLLWPGVRSHPRHPAVEAVIERLKPQLMRVRPGSSARQLLGEGGPERVLLDRLAEPARVDDLLALGLSTLFVRAALYLLAMTRQIERAPSPSQPAIPAVDARPSSPAIATPEGRPSQPFLIAPAEAIKPVDAIPRRISGTNLPRVVGTSLGEVAREAQAQPPQGTLRERIAEAELRLAMMQDQTAFEMLGIPSDTPPTAVTSAFYTLAMRWHPDAAPTHSPALREAHERIFALLAEAEATLTQERAREAYLRDVALGNGTPRARATRPRRQLDLARAELALRQGNFVECERAARDVLAEAPHDPVALTVLASALLELRPNGPYDELRRCIVDACQRDPSNDRAHIVAAQMYKRTGDERRSLLHFIKAYKINPRNVDALRDLRLAAIRKREANAIDQESAGFLSKLFGRK